MSTTSVHETAARTRKALALIEVLRATGATCDDLTDEVWADAVKAAGVHPPSDTTKAIVAEVLARTPDLTDPFVGF